MNLKRWNFLRPLLAVVAGLATLAGSSLAYADESELNVPDLHNAVVLGVDGWTLLLVGGVLCVGGMLFGLFQYAQLRRLPVHRSMLEIVTNPTVGANFVVLLIFRLADKGRLVGSAHTYLPDGSYAASTLVLEGQA